MRLLALVVSLGACAGSSDAEIVTWSSAPPAGDRDGPVQIDGPAEPEVDDERPYVSDRARLEAIGSLTSLGEVEQALYAPGDFVPLRRPRPNEWLAAHPEAGQPFDAYAAGRYQRPDGERRVLYILPLNYPASPEDPDIATLARFASSFFGVPVKRLPLAHVSSMKVKSRQRGARRQLLAPDLLDELAGRLPDDAFLLIAITGEDLYPAEDWNFVFGQATLRKRVGVYSTARYHPAFYGSDATGDRVRSIILQRTLKLMSHEVGHMFGLEHCVYYRCIMNGSNSILETDRSPHHLCPVCLRKLATGSGLDLVGRYRSLGRIYERLGMSEEAAFVRRRIDGL